MKKVLAGDWTETNVKIYCRSNEINASGTQHIIDRINNKLALAHFTSDTIQATDSTNAEKVIRNHESNPVHYVVEHGGPFWNNPLKLNQFIYALIHTLFLGVTSCIYFSLFLAPR